MGIRHTFSTRTVSRTMFVLALLAVTVVTVEARIHRVKVNIPMALPGIDQAGNIDFLGNFGDARGKVFLNTRSGRVVAILRGRTYNNSRRTYRARNGFDCSLADYAGNLILPAFEVLDDRSYYRVTRRRGRALLVCFGHIVPLDNPPLL